MRMDGIGFLHLIIGRDERTQARVLALSENNASVVAVPSTWCSALSSSVREGQEAAYMKAIASALAAEYLVQQATPAFWFTKRTRLMDVLPQDVSVAARLDAGLDRAVARVEQILGGSPTS
ncbi:hypothetical protein MW887_010167 [Aspergillus wentii]|nr:hypothetical protein MW887_010167 [Aspergillus wentii]